MYSTIQKTIAAWAFNHYIAYYYFDNVNVSQLKVAFERGEVELENLPIKKDALQHFDLPMEVVSGVVGNLSIKVPLLTLLTDPWVIKISNLMLIVAPKKQSNDISDGSTADETILSNLSTQSQFDLMQENSDANNLSEYFTDSLNLENERNDDECPVNSEETKLAEFYSSFSATMSAIVRDIYKNIRLEIDHMTILFEDFDHGLVKFNVNSLLLHRPKSVRSMVMDSTSIYLTGVGGLPNMNEGDDLLRLHIEKCNLDIHDEASNNLQLVVVQPQDSSSSSLSSQPPPATTSEKKVEGNLVGVSIDQLTSSGRRSGGSRSTTTSESEFADGKNKEGAALSRRSVLKCDTMKVEFKLNKNVDDEAIKLFEENLHLKLDLFGMQYIHSQRIYEITTQRLMNLLKFFTNLRGKQTKDQTQLISQTDRNSENKDVIRKREDTRFNKLFIVNIEEGVMYIVDDTSGPSAIPLLEFSLDDCRILQFSGKYQQNGFVFAKVGCSYYNREVSTWDTLLQPWPFSLSWDLKTSGMLGNGNKKHLKRHRKISLISDELASFVLSNAFFDIGDLALKRVVGEFIHAKFWPLATSLRPNYHGLAQDFNSIFVIHNETGHRLQFAPLEQCNELYEVYDRPSRKTTLFNLSGDSMSQSVQKLSTNSRSSNSSRDSPDLNCLARWISVDIGETVSFEYETLPIYRRHINDVVARSRMLLVRVEGWKTLVPLSIDRTGVFYREGCSDRVMNEDTYIVISIDIEKSTARKVISIRSPLNLINRLDTTLEVHFVESNRALYIKPDSHLAVPLPCLFNRMHIRPCNVGVTMSEQALSWDEIQQIFDHESKIHTCHPITVTNLKHASYCTSQSYRIRVSTKRDRPEHGDSLSDMDPIPVFSISFISPLVLVNLLPCKLQYSISGINGTLSRGSQQRIYHVDPTKSADLYFKMTGYSESKAINMDPEKFRAYGSFQLPLEMIDERNRRLYLTAKIIPASGYDDPAVQIIIYAPFWFLNKTRLPLVFKQEGADREAAGQFHEHEETAVPTLLFSFYDYEVEPPWLCCMRLGKSKGVSMFCDGAKGLSEYSDGFKLEKGSGERRFCFITNDKDSSDLKNNKSVIDINIRRGYGRYSETMIVTLTARDGFDPLTKIPRKLTVASPHNYKLTSYNHNVNLAERIAGQAISLFHNSHHKVTSDFNLKVPGLKLTLVDNSCEKFVEASVKSVAVNYSTNLKEQLLDCSVQDIRIDNFLQDCEKSVVLDRATLLKESVNLRPALRLIMDRIVGNSFGTTFFRQVQLSMCELVMNIEEKLVMKLVEFVSSRQSKQRRDNSSNLTQDLDKILNPDEDRKSKYYFDLLRIDLTSLKLSILGLFKIDFEDSQVQLEPYFKLNVSKTFRGVFESVARFYKKQIIDQAPRIFVQNYLRFHLSDLLSTLYDEVYNKLFN